MIGLPINRERAAESSGLHPSPQPPDLHEVSSEDLSSLAIPTLQHDSKSGEQTRDKDSKESEFFKERLRRRPLSETLREMMVVYRDCFKLCWDIDPGLSVKVMARSIISSVAQIASRYAFFVLAVAAKEADNPIWPLFIVGSMLFARYQSRQDTMVIPETNKLAALARLEIERKLGGIPDRASHRDLRTDFPSTFAFFREKIESGTVESLVNQAFAAPGLVLGLASAIGAIGFVDWRVGALGILSVWPYFWMQNKQARETLELEVATRHEEELANAASRAAYSLESLQLAQGGLHDSLSRQYVDRLRGVWLQRTQQQIEQSNVMTRLDYAYYGIIGLAGCTFFQYSPSIGMAVFLTDQLRQFMYEFYIAGSQFEERVTASRLFSDLDAFDRKHQYRGESEFPADSTIVVEPCQFEIVGADKFIVLEDKITIPAGALVRVTGETGAGKTTFLDYLTHGASGLEGDLTFGGIKAEHILRNSFVRSVVRVDSAPSFIRGFRIGEFLRFGSDRAISEREIYDVLSQLALLDDVMGFDDGLNSIVGSEYRGVDLSAGQIQRMGIARALLLKPKILILDESLNHIDSKTRNTVLSAISDIRRDGTTVILVEHSESLDLHEDLHLRVVRDTDYHARIEVL